MKGVKPKKKTFIVGKVCLMYVIFTKKFSKDKHILSTAFLT